MSLAKYKAKRHFRKTPEPAGTVRKRRQRRGPIFVVQEHHARRRHYDFRLEADGVLKSWAVPKGPSMNPADKRLAVHVEDHPLDYASFDGTIPQGEYGAGTVSIWDRGTYENLLVAKPKPMTVAEGVEKGRLEFRLAGKKLCGQFALVRMGKAQPGKDNWLLIKMKDEFAQEEPEPATQGQEPADVSKRAKHRKLSGPADDKQPPPIDKLPFTNLTKLMYPESGISKGDVLLFYGRISQYLLPHLRNRPVTLERFPDGIGDAKAKTHLWQKNAPNFYPDWIPRINLPTGEGKPVRYVLVNNVQTLLYLVNQGTLTFHVGMSRIEDLDRPDFVLFDLDPGAASFADAVAVAKKLHAVLQKKGNNGYIKTSGKTGLHVHVPWTGKGGYGEARSWALTIAAEVTAALPSQATTERSKARRGHRVYVDVMQNAPGKHAVPPYVLRAVPGAPVATPLNWRELTAKLTPANFNLKTIVRRLERLKQDLHGGPRPGLPDCRHHRRHEQHRRLLRTPQGGLE
jgi:bifunctional non-homologous end joining protein LigD